MRRGLRWITTAKTWKSLTFVVEARCEREGLSTGEVTAEIDRAIPALISNGQRFSKRNFRVNARDRTIMCPAGEVVPVEILQIERFHAEKLAACPLRAKCMSGKKNSGGSVSIAENEVHHQSFPPERPNPRRMKQWLSRQDGSVDGIPY